jgi:acetyltransferase AlgX (SGNH hydrolase-like protein)/WD40 repeat protein
MADTPQESQRKLTIERRVILLLATLLVGNPFVLLILTKNVRLSFLVSSACVVLMQLAFSWKHRLLAAYLFNAFAMVFAFLHAEAILLRAYPEHVVENLYTIEDGYYFNRPFLEETFTSKEYSARYRTNRQGFRIGMGQDPMTEVTNVDWLVLGDSFTQGAQVEFEDLYTTRLYERFPDKVIINAGISGQGIGHEYNYFANKGHEYRPALVILQLCSFNDFVNVEPDLVGFTDRLMTYSAFVRLLLADIKFKNPAELPLGRWTEPFHPNEQDNADYNIFFTKTSPKKQQDLDTFERYLKLFKQEVERRGSQLLVVLIPTKEQVREKYRLEVMRQFSMDAPSLDMLRPNRFLGELTRKLNIGVVDLLSAFQQAQSNVFFEYDEHMTSVGHEIMAGEIGNYVEKAFGQSKVHLLSTEFVGDRYPMFSHDGSLISYQSFRDGNMELFVARPDLSDRVRLTFNDVDESHPMLSRDNARIVFTEGAPETLRTKVVLMKTDGSERASLTPASDEFGAIPSFSPSNDEIAYAAWRYESAGSRYSSPQIFLLNVESKARTPITAPGRETWRPVFSPDGKQLAYIAKSNGQFDIYLYDIESKSERQITKTAFDEWDPQFTSDGSRVVYAARPDGNWDLFLTHLGTGHTIRLTQTKGDEWDPSVAPDGSSLLFAGRFGLLDAAFWMQLPE